MMNRVQLVALMAAIINAGDENETLDGAVDRAWRLLDLVEQRNIERATGT